jgi:hypothetical protein
MKSVGKTPAVTWRFWHGRGRAANQVLVDYSSQKVDMQFEAFNHALLRAGGAAVEITLVKGKRIMINAAGKNTSPHR